MDKKSIAILLVTTSFASSAFANSILNQLTTKHRSTTPSIIKTHKMAQENNRSYTDFSGTWMVNCGDGVNGTTVIENSLNYITLDGEEFRIGQGLQGKYESNEEDARYEHMSFEWSADGSALIMKSVEVSKDSINDSAIQTDLSTFSLTMKNGQLNLDGKWTMFENVTQIEQPRTVHCVFTRKQ